MFNCILSDICVGDDYLFGLVNIYMFYYFFLNIFILWDISFNNDDIILYPIFNTSLHISTYDITLFLYIVSHIILDCYYIFIKSLKKISLYHKEGFVLITWNQYADLGLSHVLFWLHPLQNDLILLISPLYKYLWHYYVLYIDSQNGK